MEGSKMAGGILLIQSLKGLLSEGVEVKPMILMAHVMLCLSEKVKSSGP